MLPLSLKSDSMSSVYHDTLMNIYQLLDVTAPTQGILSEICDHAAQTVENTTLGGYDWSSLGVAIVALLISFIALRYTIFTYKAQQRTEEHSARTQGNTQRISLQAQKGLLEDLVRHLYRNLVVTYAIKSKMNHFGYDKVYPSEEHLIKLKVPVQNIHLEAFYSDDMHYKKINELYLQLRNYNEEIGVALKHFCDPRMVESVKERDFSTLIFKPGFLTEKIMTVLKEVWPDDTNIYEDTASLIREGSWNPTATKPQDTPWVYPYEKMSKEDTPFVTCLFAHTEGSRQVAAELFLTRFNADVCYECGAHDKNIKINMIEFPED